ncbi:MAG: hypothetical protein FJ027_21235 [Candidatus Rokubacteria bacterium]|nr:hypothetical protein [Candidatus Rokubacteria bacterium]
MRTLTPLVLALAVVSFTAAPGLAQSSGAPAQDKAAVKTASQNVSGTVRSATNDTVVVAGRDKGREMEWTFAIEPTTSIRKGTKSIIGADLKAGDAVQVRFFERDGRAQADSILVRSSKKDANK